MMTMKNVIMENIKVWELAKDCLLIRMLPLQQVRDGVLHRNICGDIAMCVYFQIESGDNVYAAGITQSLRRHWEKSEDEVFRLAMENTKNSMIVISDITGLFFGTLATADITDDFSKQLYVGITTKSKTYGAGAIFSPGVADKLLKSFKCDKLYISFTSKHEAMVHNAELLDPNELKEILRQTANEATLPEDYLSDKIYQYDGAGFSIVA